MSIRAVGIAVAVTLVVVVGVILCTRSCGERGNVRDGRSSVVVEQHPTPGPRARATMTAGAPEPEPALLSTVIEAPREPTVAGEEALVIRVTSRGRSVSRCRFELVGSGGVSCTSTDLGDGNYRVEFQGDVPMPFDVEAVTPSGRRGRCSVTSGRGAWEIAIEPGGRLDGALVDDEGRPVHGGRIYGGERTAVTDASGWFALDEMPLGEYGGIVVCSAGLTVEIRRQFRLDSESPRERITFTLIKSSGFDVRVVAADDGSAIAAAGVRFAPADRPGRSGALDAATDEEGRLRAEGLPPGDYWCWVEHKEFEVSDPVMVRAPRHDALLLRCVRRTRRTLRGLVVDSAGLAVAGRRVWCGDGRASLTSETDGAGRFEFADVAETATGTGRLIPRPAPPRVRVAVSGSAMPDEFVVEWDRENRLVVGAAVTWRGVIVDETGRSLTAVQLTHRSGDGGVRSNSAALGGAAGASRTFEWKEGPGTAGTLEFRASDGRVHSIPVDPAEQRTVDLGRVVLPRGGTVSLGAIPGLTGTERVSLTLCQPDSLVPVTSARVRLADGAWTTSDSVTPGAWELVVNVEGHLPCHAGAVRIASGVRTSVDVRPLRPTELQVQVLRGGSVVPGWRVRFVPDDSAIGSIRLRRVMFGLTGEVPLRLPADVDPLDAVTDRVGRVAFSRLPAGAAGIEVLDPSGRLAVRQPIHLPLASDELVIELEER